MTFSPTAGGLPPSALCVVISYSGRAGPKSSNNFDDPAGKTKSACPIRLILADEDTRIQQTVRRALAGNPTRWAVEFHSNYSNLLTSILSGKTGLRSSLFRTTNEGTRRTKASSVPISTIAHHKCQLAVILLADSIAGTSCVRCLRHLSGAVPEIPVVVLAATSDPHKVLEVVMAGARGFILKPLASRKLLRLLTRAVKGWPAFCRRAEAALLAALGPAGGWSSARLTPREQQVLTLLFRRRSNKEISSKN